MSTRITAPDRLNRLLSLVPWVAAQDGPPIAEVCARFGMTRQQLLADLDILFMVGLYPYTPDELIEVVVDDDRVWIHYADFFERPLRLTPEQALGLVAGSASMFAVEGAEPDGPLARGLQKLGDALGISTEEAVAIRLGDAPADTMAVVQDAISRKITVEIDYYAYGRDARSTRVVEPYRVYADQGHWYLAAYCRRAGADRVFRLDRVESATLLDETFEPPAATSGTASYRARPEDPRITLELDQHAHWVLQQYPCEHVEFDADNQAIVTLAVSAVPWLERLLLRLGPDASVVRFDPPLDAEIARRAAARVLARYEE